jgi:hypothetical protein
MAGQEAKDYYYGKAKKDFLIGYYDQPFPSAMVMELDEFEKLCNKAYKQGYGDAAEELKSKKF